MDFLLKKQAFMKLFLWVSVFLFGSNSLEAYFLFSDHEHPTPEIVYREVNEYLTRGFELKAGDERGVSGQFLKRLGFEILLTSSKQLNYGLIKKNGNSLLFKLIDQIYSKNDAGKKLEDYEFVVLLGISSLFSNDLAGLVAAKKDKNANYFARMVGERREILMAGKYVQTLNSIPKDKWPYECVATARTYFTFHPQVLYSKTSDLVGNDGKALRDIDFQDPENQAQILEIKAILQAYGYDVDQRFDFLINNSLKDFNFGRLSAAFAWQNKKTALGADYQSENLGSTSVAICQELLNFQLYPVKERATFIKLVRNGEESDWNGSFDHQAIIDEIDSFDLQAQNIESFRGKFFQILCANISFTNDQRQQIAMKILSKIYELYKTNSWFGLSSAIQQSVASRNKTIESFQREQSTFEKFIGQGLNGGFEDQRKHLQEIERTQSLISDTFKGAAIQANSEKMAEIAFIIVNLNFWIDLFRNVSTELLMENLRFAFSSKFGNFWQFWRDPNRVLPKERRSPEEDQFFRRRDAAKSLLSSAQQFSKVISQQNSKLSAILSGVHADDLVPYLADKTTDYIVQELWAIFASLSDQTLDDFIDKNFDKQKATNIDLMDKIITFFKRQTLDADLAKSLNYLFVFNQTKQQSFINANLVCEIARRIQQARAICQNYTNKQGGTLQQSKSVLESVTKGTSTGLINADKSVRNIDYDTRGQLFIDETSYARDNMLSGLSEQAQKVKTKKGEEAIKYKRSFETKLMSAAAAPIAAPVIGAVAGTVLGGYGGVPGVAIGAGLGASIGAVAGVVSGVGLAADAVGDKYKQKHASAEGAKFSGLATKLTPANQDKVDVVEWTSDQGSEETASVGPEVGDSDQDSIASDDFQSQEEEPTLRRTQSAPVLRRSQSLDSDTTTPRELLERPIIDPNRQAQLLNRRPSTPLTLVPSSIP